MNPIDILNKFIIQELNGDVFLLLDYDLKRLKNNAVLGCPNRRFDPDDTNLMRAVYCIVFGDVWTNLSLENSGDGKLRGDTINSSATFFSYPWNDKFTPKWEPSIELTEKIKNFQHTFHTIGNMMVLPDKRIDGWSINKHRGCHDEWHDYEDRFLSALYKVLTNKSDFDEDLMELVQQMMKTLLLFMGKKDGATSLMVIYLMTMLMLIFFQLSKPKAIHGGEEAMSTSNATLQKPIGI